MKNHDGGDDDGDNNGNENKDDVNNAASVSGSDGPIFDWILMPWSCGGGPGDDDNGAADEAPYVSTCWNISTVWMKSLTIKWHIL